MACNTAFSVSCVNTVSVLSLAQTSENTLREFPLVIAAVAKVSRKRGLWLVVRVNKKPAEDPPQADVLKFILHRTGVRSRSQRKPR